tara:strand:- start:499 stop:837 length:339 start_codon:yes stop_codon:yes gene_type:complete
MAQDFESKGVLVTDSETAILSGSEINSDDAIIGLRLCNILTTAITMDVYIDMNSAGTNYYLCKKLSIPPTSSVELIQGGAKVVVQATDDLYGECGTADGCHVWVSYVDEISE